MSIRYDEQGDTPSPLTAKRPSRQYPWQVWDFQNEAWLDIGRTKVDLMALAFPDIHIEGYRLKAARYLDRVIQKCDGYHALVTYRKIGEALHIALVRSDTAFTVGTRQPPEWTRMPPSAWERVGQSDGPV